MEGVEGDLIWELRRLLAWSGSTIADVTQALELRGSELDAEARSLLQEGTRRARLRPRAAQGGPDRADGLGRAVRAPAGRRDPAPRRARAQCRRGRGRERAQPLVGLPFRRQWTSSAQSTPAARTRRSAQSGSARHPGRAVRTGPVGAQPPSHEPVAVPRARATRPRELERGGRPRRGGQARPRTDAGGRHLRSIRGPGPGPGGPPCQRVCGLRGSARGARPRACGLLAHPRGF